MVASHGPLVLLHFLIMMIEAGNYDGATSIYGNTSPHRPCRF